MLSLQNDYIGSGKRKKSGNLMESEIVNYNAQ